MSYRRAFIFLMFRICNRFLSQIKSSDEQKYSNDNERNILEKAWNIDPRRENKENCYSAFDSEW